MDPNQQIPQGGGNPQGPNGQQGNPSGPNGQQIRPPWPWPAYFPCCPWPMFLPYFPPYLHYPFDAHVGLGIPGQGGAVPGFAGVPIGGVGAQGQGGAVPGFAGVRNGGVGAQGQGGAAGVGRQGQGGIAPAGVYGGIGVQGQGGAMAGAAGVQNGGVGVPALGGAGPRPFNAQNGGIPAQAVWVPDVGGNAPGGEQQGLAGRKRPRFNDEEASNISYTFKFYGTNHAPLAVVKDPYYGNLQVHVPGAVPRQLAPANAVHVPGADHQQVAPANTHVPLDDQASNHL